MSGKRIWITERDKKKITNLIKDIEELKSRGVLQKIETELDQAKVVKSKEIPENIVTMNCIVRLRDSDTLEEKEYWLRFLREPEDFSRVVPILSDLGIALLGSKEGDIIEWYGPSKKRRSTVVEIVYQPERLGNYEL